MSQNLHHCTTVATACHRFVLTGLITVLMGFSICSYAVEFEYIGLVEGGTGALETLVPVGSPLAGPIELDVTPGGTVTDPADFLSTLLIMTNVENGTNLFCFFFDADCVPGGGTPVPVIDVTDINLDIDDQPCPVAGSIDILAFSPTLVVNIPITLDITNGTFLADAGVLGTSTGSGNFTCNVPPEFDADPDPAVPITFTEAFLGDPPQTETITITNTGNAEFDIGMVNIDGDVDFSIEDGDDNCGGQSVAPNGGTCTITVTYTPTTLGGVSATLTISPDGGSEPLVVYTVEGTGLVPPGDLSSDAPLGIVDTIVGQTMTGDITVTNMSSGPLTIQQIETTDMLTAPFSIVADTCSAEELMSMESCTITVQFAPTEEGEFTDSFDIPSDDPDSPAIVMVSGVGVVEMLPDIELDTDTLVFSSLALGQSEDLMVVVSNVGTDDLTINDITIDPTGEFSFDSGDCPDVLTPMGTCTLTVTFAPTQEGMATATLSIASNDPDSPEEVALSGTATSQPEITVDPELLDFGVTTVGESEMGIITITNDGTADLVIDSINLAAGDFTEENDCAVLAPNASCTITVTFIPSMEGIIEDTITIVSNDEDETMVGVNLAGQGVIIPEPNIDWDGTPLGFGSLLLGESASDDVVVTNNGNDDLVISSVMLTGADAAEFSVAEDCVGTLVTDAICTITVTFEPTMEGDAVATLVINSDDPDTPAAEVDLMGTGVMPLSEIDVAPLSIDFGAVVVGDTDTDMVTITNLGNADLMIFSLNLDGVNAADFNETNNCGDVVPMGASCTVTLTYEPSVDGAAAATLTIESDDADEATVEVALVAMATPMPMPMIEVADALDLGDVALNTSGLMDLEVTNTGSAPLIISEVAIGGANAADFDHDFDQASDCATVEVGASCTISVAFTPTVAGQANAELTITSNDMTAPNAVVALTGNAPVPILELNVESIDFGSVNAGQSAAQSVTMTNAGDAELSINELNLGGADASDFSVPNTCASVAPGASCTLTVTYTPSSEGVVDASLEVVSNDTVNGTVVLTISATGAPQEEVIVTVASSGNSSGSFGLLELVAMLSFAVLARARKLLPLITAAVLMGVPSALADDTYWYFGGSWGSSDGNADIGDVQNGLAAVGVTASAIDIDDSDNGYKVSIGYHATPRLAFEFSYVNLGEADINLQLGAVTLEQIPLISRTVSESISFLGDGYSGAVLVKQPFADNFAVFGKVGLFSWEVDSVIGGTTSLGALDVTETESATDFTFGIGGEFHFAEHFAVRAEWERFELGDEDADLISIGAYLKF